MEHKEKYLLYLLELRRRLLVVGGGFIILFLICFYFSSELLFLLIKPFLQVLPSANFLIATSLTAPLLMPLGLAADFALILTVPIALLQIWHFVTPGLYQHEKRRLGWIVGGSVLLFAVGVIFDFIVILPYLLQFLAKGMPASVHYLPEVMGSIHFIMRTMLWFGFFFQLPLLCVVSVQSGWMKIDQLKSMRPYFMVGAFIVGMLLTPPDVFAQIVVAVPLCVLFELGIGAASLSCRRNRVKKMA